MLDFVFGLNARVGRLYFLLSFIAAVVAAVAADLALSPYSIQEMASGAKPRANPYAWPLIVSTVGFLLIKYNLKSMRIRDMGWDPVCIISAWIAMDIVDTVVASKVPAWSWSVGHHHFHGTIVGVTIDIALLLALVLWPSSDGETPTPTFGDQRRRSFQSR